MGNVKTKMDYSIITINYNNCEGLRRTIESVVAQTCRDFEYIVIDGGSTDGSVDVIKRYAQQIDYWVSEPDKGIYNAMNKGVAQAHGEYCLFMNSGDMFHDKKVVELLHRFADKSDIIYGNAFRVDRVVEYPDEITGFYMFNNAICHQSVLIRRDLLVQKPYEEDYKIVADWKHMFALLILQGASYRHVNITVCDYDTNGISTENWAQVLEEREKALKDMLPKRIYDDYYRISCQEESMNNSKKVYDAVHKVQSGSVDEQFVIGSLRLLNFLRRIKHFFEV